MKLIVNADTERHLPLLVKTLDALGACKESEGSYWQSSMTLVEIAILAVTTVTPVSGHSLQYTLILVS